MNNQPNNNNNNLVVVIAGPTAVGKSDVAARLNFKSQRPAIIVSADSVQAYCGVMIGANKPTMEERQETPHLLVDVVDHTQDYSAAEWRKDALYVISKLLMAGNNTDNNDNDTTIDSDIDDDDEGEIAVTPADQERRTEIDQSIADAKRIKGYNNNDNNDKTEEPILPVVVGGTMMYLQWLVHGRPDAVKPSPEVVEQAQKEIQAFQDNDNWQGAVQHVESQGPIFAQRITTLCGQDWYRLRRTLEIALTVQEQQQQANDNAENHNHDKEALVETLFSGQREGSLESYGYDVRCFFLCPDDRMKHTELVDERCEVMITRGLMRETTELQLAGQLPDMAARAIGYRQTLEYLQRENAQDGDEEAFQEYLNQFTTATRRYSKKQMQWFRKDKKFVFVPVAIKEDKETRVSETAKAIEHLIQLPREEFERECFSEGSVSEETIKQNEAQAKKMKFYQFKRYHLTPGSALTESTLAEADRCTNQIQSKSLEEQPVQESQS